MCSLPDEYYDDEIEEDVAEDSYTDGGQLGQGDGGTVSAVERNAAGSSHGIVEISV